MCILSEGTESTPQRSQSVSYRRASKQPSCAWEQWSGPQAEQTALEVLVRACIPAVLILVPCRTRPSDQVIRSVHQFFVIGLTFPTTRLFVLISDGFSHVLAQVPGHSAGPKTVSERIDRAIMGTSHVVFLPPLHSCSERLIPHAVCFEKSENVPDVYASRRVKMFPTFR